MAAGSKVPRSLVAVPEEELTARDVMRREPLEMHRRSGNEPDVPRVRFSIYQKEILMKPGGQGNFQPSDSCVCKYTVTAGVHRKGLYLKRNVKPE